MESQPCRSVTPLLGPKLLPARPCGGCRAAIDGFYCQVVLNGVVPGAACWQPHEIAVES